MFVLERANQKDNYATFKRSQNGDKMHYTGSGRRPYVFLHEHIAHETRADFGLEKSFNVVKIVKEEGTRKQDPCKHSWEAIDVTAVPELELCTICGMIIG